MIRLAWDWADEEEEADNLLNPATADNSTVTATFFSDVAPAVETPARRNAKTASSHVHSGPTAVASPSTPSSARPVSDARDGNHPNLAGTTTTKFALARRPTIVEILDMTGTERGAFEAGRVRIVTSRRVSARAGAERRVSSFIEVILTRQVIVGTEYEQGDHLRMKLVPLGGAWDTVGQAAGLHASAKNPMSLALDHDKLVVSLHRR